MVYLAFNANTELKKWNTKTNSIMSENIKFNFKRTLTTTPAII